jgi:hypothetical protein
MSAVPAAATVPWTMLLLVPIVIHYCAPASAKYLGKHDCWKPVEITTLNALAAHVLHIRQRPQAARVLHDLDRSACLHRRRAKELCLHGGGVMHSRALRGLAQPHCSLCTASRSCYSEHVEPDRHRALIVSEPNRSAESVRSPRAIPLDIAACDALRCRRLFFNGLRLICMLLRVGVRAIGCLNA